MTKRRRPKLDDEVKEPTTGVKPSRWPPSPQSENAEVALFTVRGPAKPGAAIIDVRSANRLRVGDELPAAGTEADPSTLQTLIAQQVSAALEQSELAEYAANDVDPGELVLNTETAPSGDQAGPVLELTVHDEDDAFADRPLDAFPSELPADASASVDRGVDAPAHLDEFRSQLAEELPAASPEPAVSLAGLAEDRLTANAAQPAARTETAAPLWSRVTTQLTGWQSAVKGMPVPQLRRLRLGPLAAALVLLAVGVAMLYQVEPAEPPAFVTADRETEASQGPSLTVQPIDTVASLAPSLGARPAAVEPAAPEPAARADEEAESRPPVSGAAGAEALRIERRTTTQESIPPSLAARDQRATAENPRRETAVGTAGGPRESALRTAAAGESPVAAVAPRPPARQDASARPATARPATAIPADATTAAANSAAASSATADTRTAIPATLSTPTASSETAPAAVTTDVVARAEPPSATMVPESGTPLPVPAPPAAASTADTMRAEAPRPDRAAPVNELAADDGISQALKHLQRAYERRDATMVKAVWPTVNERAMARAFDGLRSQSVTFDRCQLNVAGAAGEVVCRGVTTYVPRVGSQYQRTESRQWKFSVRKGADAWVITSAAAR
jgi:hypothetical protein